MDQSIIVFGVVFPRVAQKHRLQMLQHFSEHIKQAQQTKTKNNHSDAVQLNIFTAVLSSLKGLVEAKAKFGGQEEVKNAAVSLIIGTVCDGFLLGKKFAAECLCKKSVDCQPVLTNCVRDIIDKLNMPFAAPRKRYEVF